MADLPRITIFESLSDGYGNARRSRFDTLPYSYSRAYGNVEPRLSSEVGPGFAVKVIATGNLRDAPLGGREWEDSSGNPIVLYVGNSTSAQSNIYKIQAGQAVIEQACAGTILATAAELHDNGAGIPYYYIGFGGASANKLQYRTREAVLAAAATVYGDKLLSLNGDLYVTFTPPSGTANSAIGKIAAGTNPVTELQPTPTIVGFAGTHINNVVADGTGKVPVCLKPEGIFIYDLSIAAWVPVAGWMSYFRHPDNGKRYWCEGNDLIVALGAGGAVRWDGQSLTTFDLIPMDATPDQDTTVQVIAAAGGYGHWGLLATQIGAKRQRTGGTGSTSEAHTAKLVDVGKTTDGTTYTDYSTEASDGDPTTTIAIGALDTAANNDWLVIGHPLPFNGIYFDVSTASTTTSTLSVDIWNGTAWVAASWYDLTTSNAGGITLNRPGWILNGDTSPIELGWVPHELTVGSAKTRYWARIKVSALLSAGTAVKAIEPLPWRPNITELVGALTSEGADRSGCLPHWLLSRITETGQHVTFDMGSLGVPDEIGIAMYANVGGASQNDDRVILLIGKRTVWGILTPSIEQISQTAWPILGYAGGASGGLVELPTRDVGTSVRLEDIRIEGAEWDATGYLFGRTEDGSPWQQLATWSSLPITLPGDMAVRGRYWRFAIGWSLTPAQQRPAGRPRITSITAQPQPAELERGNLGVQTPPIV